MRKYVQMNSPICGITKDITKVNDPVFSSKMVGDGIAIEPKTNIVVAPCNGTIDHMFATNHAFTIVTKDKAEILIHLGIDTVDLKGEGFKRLFTDLKKPVKIGDPIIEIDLPYLEEQGKITDVIVIVTDANSTLKLKKKLNKTVDTTDEIFKYSLS